jgi:hypothetical protein
MISFDSTFNFLRNQTRICLLIFGIIVAVGLISCGAEEEKNNSSTYVKPSVDYKGKYRKGHVRMKQSTQKNATQKRNQSRYYYQTRGKFRRKKD